MFFPTTFKKATHLIAILGYFFLLYKRKKIIINIMKLPKILKSKKFWTGAATAGSGITGLVLGSVYHETLKDMFAFGNTWESVATYSIISVILLVLGIWGVVSFVFNRKGRKAKKNADIAQEMKDAEQIKNLKLEREKLELELQKMKEKKD